jgi:hypothetical protein
MSGYVSEEPRNWDDGFIETLGNPNHFRITPCEVVDYTNAPAERGPASWEPLLAAQPEPPEQPRSRWALLKAVFTRGAKT